MENHLIYTLRGAIPGDLRCQFQSPYGILQSTHIYVASSAAASVTGSLECKVKATAAHVISQETTFR